MREMPALPAEILDAVQHALAEDLGPGDATTEAIVPAGARMQGQIIAKQVGVIAGLDVAAAVFRALDPQVQFSARVDEGARVEKGQVLAIVSGPARSLLSAERTALNFLGRMSGIATQTRAFVQAVEGTGAVILDTRKTAPGLRLVDKLAVQRGGGQNHRRGLYDMILIKDNHIDFAGSLPQAVECARAARSGLPIEVEARSLQDVQAALELNVERILLDNMTPEEMSRAVGLRHAWRNGRAGQAPLLEASGNVTLETVRRIAETGVEFISVGALTHSSRVLDVSFDYLPGTSNLMDDQAHP
jgi:nicotinate-nucleotide pyrophosphorylase (carboxylating)